MARQVAVRQLQKPRTTNSLHIVRKHTNMRVQVVASQPRLRVNLSVSLHVCVRTKRRLKCSKASDRRQRLFGSGATWRPRSSEHDSGKELDREHSAMYRGE